MTSGAPAAFLVGFDHIFDIRQMKVLASTAERYVGQDSRFDGSGAGVEKIVDQVSAALRREVINDELKLSVLRAIAWAKRADFDLLGDGIDRSRRKADAGNRVVATAQDVRRWHNQSGREGGCGGVSDVCACAHAAAVRSGIAPFTLVNPRLTARFARTALIFLMVVRSRELIAPSTMR